MACSWRVSCPPEHSGGPGGLIDLSTSWIGTTVGLLKVVPTARLRVIRPITDEGVAVGGAFAGDTATGMMPIAHRVTGVGSFREL
jgi:hypothetical protein